MGYISEEDVERVKNSVDIAEIVSEYVTLRPRGKELWGCCPFHQEKTPSFKVNSQTQLWHCFGQCSEGGDVFKFIMKKEHYDFPEAVRYLANKAHIEIKEQEGSMPTGYRGRLLAVCKETADFYHTQLMRGKGKACDDAREYLGSRGLGGKLPKKWNLGYAPGKNTLIKRLSTLRFSSQEMLDAGVALRQENGELRDRFYNRVMFPIRDLQGREIAFGGRIIGSGEPKYINTSNCPLFSKRENLFGIDFAKSAIVSSATAIVVEGYTDVIAMHEAGFNNTVATLGTALTTQHVKLLTRFAKKIIYLFDGDAAGQKAAERASELITPEITPESGSKQVSLYVAVIPDEMDPAEYIEASGNEGMEKVLENAGPLLRFVIDKRISEEDLSTPELRSQSLSNVLQLLVPIRDSILADEYINYLADIFKLDFERVKKTLRSLKPARRIVNYDENNPAYASSSTFSVSSNEIGSATDATSDSTKFEVPSDGGGKWETQLICMYMEYPAARQEIISGMLDEKWCSELYEQIMHIADKCGVGAEGSSVISKVLEKYPEAESVFSSSTVFIGEEDDAAALVRLMLKQRKEAYLSENISALNNKLKYDKSLKENDRKELFEKISRLQKDLSELRR